MNNFKRYKQELLDDVRLEIEALEAELRYMAYMNEGVFVDRKAEIEEELTILHNKYESIKYATKEELTYDLGGV